jgi:rhodanese-related sulfurtransferase
MKEVSVAELKAKIDAKEDFQLIDIREQHEIDIAQIGGEHIPMNDVMISLDKISKDKPVIIHCRSGQRSGAVVQALESQMGFDNLYNLAGGILAWSDEIDSSVVKY